MKARPIPPNPRQGYKSVRIATRAAGREAQPVSPVRAKRAAAHPVIPPTCREIRGHLRTLPAIWDVPLDDPGSSSGWRTVRSCLVAGDDAGRTTSDAGETDPGQ